jgi:hypothetical protein
VRGMGDVDNSDDVAGGVLCDIISSIEDRGRKRANRAVL